MDLELLKKALAKEAFIILAQKNKYSVAFDGSNNCDLLLLPNEGGDLAGFRMRNKESIKQFFLRVEKKMGWMKGA